MRRFVSSIYVGLAWLTVLWLLATILMAGMALFVRNSIWDLHIELGWTSGWPPLLLIILGLALRIPRQLTPWLVAVFVLHTVQTFLPGLRDQLPYLSALHPLNASILTFIAYLHARKAGELLLSRTTDREAAAAAGRQVEA